MNSNTRLEVAWLHWHDRLYEEEFNMPDLYKTKVIFSKTTEGFTCSVGWWKIGLTEEGRTHVQYSLISRDEHIYAILDRFF